MNHDALADRQMGAIGAPRFGLIVAAGKGARAQGALCD